MLQHCDVVAVRKPCARLHLTNGSRRSAINTNQNQTMRLSNHRIRRISTLLVSRGVRPIRSTRAKGRNPATYESVRLFFVALPPCLLAALPCPTRCLPARFCRPLELKAVALISMGVGTACRLDDLEDTAGYAHEFKAKDQADCARKCEDDPQCNGIEYQWETKNCEIWHERPRQVKQMTTNRPECFRRPEENRTFAPLPGAWCFRQWCLLKCVHVDSVYALAIATHTLYTLSLYPNTPCGWG